MGLSVLNRSSSSSGSFTKRSPFRSLKNDNAPIVRGFSAWSSPGNVSSITVTLPAGTQVGDALCVIINQGQFSANPSPANWQGNFVNAGGAGASLWAGARNAKITAAEIAAGTITIALSATIGANARLVCMTFAGPTGASFLVPYFSGSSAGTTTAGGVASFGITASGLLGTAVWVWSTNGPTNTSAAFATPANAVNPLVSNVDTQSGVAYALAEGHPSPNTGVTITATGGTVSAYSAAFLSFAWMPLALSTSMSPKDNPIELFLSAPFDVKALEMQILPITNATGNANAYVVDIYTGAAGAETYLTSFTTYANGGSGAGNNYPVQQVPAVIPQNTRISFKIAPEVVATSTSTPISPPSSNANSSFFVEGALLG